MARRLVVVGTVAAACAGGAGGAAGCGGSNSASQPVAPAPERNDPAARLPSRWKRLVNRGAGFSVGLPPGWRAGGGRGATLVRSGDRLLAVSITADRSADGRDLAPRVYAARIARALPGYRGLRVRGPAGVRGAHYPAGAATATGRFVRTHVRQAIRVVALHRRGQVTYVIVFFRTARAPGALYSPAIDGMVRTFRARAPG